MNDNKLIGKMKFAEYKNLKRHLSKLKLEQLSQAPKEEYNSADPKSKALKELQNLKAKPLKKEITETADMINKLEGELNSLVAIIIAENKDQEITIK